MTQEKPLPYRRLFSGGVYVFRRPDPDQITLKDVAHALALINRFNGHTLEPYNVAQHSVLGTRWLREAGYGTEVQREFQMHDACEALVGDISSPLKTEMRLLRGLADGYEDGLSSGFDHAEEVAHQAIQKRFRLMKRRGDKLDLLIREIDLRMLLTEQRDLMPVGPGSEVSNAAISFKPFDFKITPWDWKQAEREFLLECERLGVA